MWVMCHSNLGGSISWASIMQLQQCILPSATPKGLRPKPNWYLKCIHSSPIYLSHYHMIFSKREDLYEVHTKLWIVPVNEDKILMSIKSIILSD